MPVDASLPLSESGRYVFLERRCGEFVVRRQREAGLKFQREIGIQRAIARSGRAPKVVALQSARGFFWSQYAPPLSARIQDLSNPILLDMIECLKTVHQSTPHAATIDLRQTANTYAARAKNSELATDTLSKLEVAMAQVETRPRVLCHMDPHPANWVGGRQCRLIDWEFASYCDPLFDLAGFAIEWLLSTEQTEYALSCYFGGRRRPNDWLSWVTIYQCMSTLWRAGRSPTNRFAVPEASKTRFARWVPTRGRRSAV